MDRGTLTRIYERRARHVNRKNIPYLGFDELVTRLGACALEHVIFGTVKGADPAYSYQLFLSPDASRVVACLGVRAQRERPAHTTPD
ncbi:hypothetical protein [Spongiactinospora sp. TRM90649]|uniref:hypothetical protein n=1 Tax=Spongiactinospora sp. TRM90649 TaxID=3031114 RepID=UPI0023F83EF6|nr:hypothetical protein [Spongiactinospora sp. TRM90649]MDF5751934.1 hypothetical protein [Spongiactinospora sp. TRM90649]